MIKYAQEKKPREATNEYKRVQKFAIESTKRESILEAQTGNNDYRAGIVFDLSNAEDDKQVAIKKNKNELKF